MNDLLVDIGNDQFIRVDSEHRIDWRINSCKPPTKLVLKTNSKPSNFKDTTGVRIVTLSQKIGGYAIIFVLNDELCAETFNVFCNDVIESSRNINPDEAADYAYERYAKWMHLFKPTNNRKPSATEIQGLIGELYVLKTKFIPHYGPSSALKSWMNRLRGKQDFIENDQWYEIKSLLEGNNSIHISSLEQLSRKDKGELIIVNLKKSSPKSDKRITLNTLYSDIIDLLPSFSLKKMFAETIISNGIIVGDEYYDNHCYEIIKSVGYNVGDNFPRLTPDNIPYSGIIRAKYEISIESLKEFEVEEWN